MAVELTQTSNNYQAFPVVTLLQCWLGVCSRTDMVALKKNWDRLATKKTFQWMCIFVCFLGGFFTNLHITIIWGNLPAHTYATTASPMFTVPVEYGPVWNENLNHGLAEEVRKSVEFYKTVSKFGAVSNIKKMNLGLSREELACQLKARVPLRTIRSGDGPFSGKDWEQYLPKQSPKEQLGPIKTCAVVMSSGSMANSRLGAEIDGHDAVLRFNAAPTEGFSVDVGNKTTLRIVNSQLITSKKKAFLTNPLYNTGLLMMWDPAPYSRDLYAWYKRPDFNFHQTYRDYRRRHPDQPFYILSPSFQWDLWDIIQETAPMEIQPNPPSSGMLGIVAMMSLCDKISVYEFLPSHRRSALCHYYQNTYDKRCTNGHYHPLVFEKKVIKKLNRGTDYEIYAFGKVTLGGFSQYSCT